jgi:hypothetical protein
LSFCAVKDFFYAFFILDWDECGLAGDMRVTASGLKGSADYADF